MSSPLRLYEALNWASSFLLKKGREPKAAEYLLMHRLGLSRTMFLASQRDVLDSEDFKWFEAAVMKHGVGVPYQHIIGEEQFYGRRFHVSPNVLIPRPETEELIFGALNLKKTLFGDSAVSYCDVGTGSGAIAITLALEDPSSHVTAIDLSFEALEVAKENAARLGARVDFIEGDLLTPVVGQAAFNIVLSNPPYIPSATVDALDPLVKDHDPRLALDGGEDGLEPYRRLAEQLPKVVTDPLFLIGFEIGVGQGEAVQRYLQKAFQKKLVTQVRYDLNGRERFVYGWSAK